jgi:hypothetical protein
MLGFRHFRRAAITFASFELMHRIRKGQFLLSKIGAAGKAATDGARYFAPAPKNLVATLAAA